MAAAAEDQDLVQLVRDRLQVPTAAAGVLDQHLVKLALQREALLFTPEEEAALSRLIVELVPAFRVTETRKYEVVKGARFRHPQRRLRSASGPGRPG